MCWTGGQCQVPDERQREASRRQAMTPVIPQGLTGRVCPKSLGSCGQPSSPSEAVVRAVTQWLPEAGSTGWRCLDDGWAASNPHPRLPTEPRELMPAPQQSWSLSALPPGLLRGHDHRHSLRMSRGSSWPEDLGPEPQAQPRDCQEPFSSALPVGGSRALQPV